MFADQSLALPHFARENAHHKKSELGGRFRQHVSRVREWDFVSIGVGAVDVVESHCDLRHDLECSLPGFKYFGVDWIAQSGDQAVDAALYFFDDQLLRRRFRPLVNFEIIAALAHTVLGRVANARRGEHAELFVVYHSCSRI